MLSCMDLYGLVETPGLIPGVEVGVAGVGHDKGFPNVFWVQESMSYFGGRDRSNKVLVDIFGKHLRVTVPHYIDLHISNMWSCGGLPTVVWPGN